MKHIFSILAFALLLTGCKKEKQPEPALPSKKLVRVNSVNSPGSIWYFSYGSAGKLSGTKFLKHSEVFQHSENGFYYQKVDTTTNQVAAEILNAVKDSKGRLVQFVTKRYSNGNATIRNEKCEYNAEGYLSKFTSFNTSSNVESVFNFEYQGGDLVKTSQLDNGVPKYVETFEYYLDKPNKLNIDYFEQKLLGFLSDEAFGKQNKHLLKMYKITSPLNQVTYHNEYAYELDADGYPVSMTGNYVLTGHLEKRLFYFQ